jgi:hypothetical protein
LLAQEQIFGGQRGAIPQKSSTEAVISFAAFAAEPFNFALVRRVAIVGPLFPTDVQLFQQKALLCQLQSCLGGELSIVTPAVGDDFLVLGKNRGEVFQLFHWGTQCARDVSARECLFPTRVEKDEVEGSALDGVQYIIPLLFSPELMGEVVAVGADFFGAKCHDAS